MSKESVYVELVAVYTRLLHWIWNHFQSGLALFSANVPMLSLPSLTTRPSGGSRPNNEEGSGKPGKWHVITGTWISYNGCDVACAAQTFHGLPFKWCSTVHAVKKLAFYGHTTPTATGIQRLRLWAYHAYGYGRTWSTATGHYAYGYRRTAPAATGVLHLRLWAYPGYNYGRATGVLWAWGRV